MIYSYIAESVILRQIFLTISFWAIFCYALENFISLFTIIYSMICESFNGDNTKSFNNKYGEWAVITGSTDGIGKGYAFELASRGMKIVLISRNETKLKNVAKEIETQFSVETKWIVADFGTGEKVYDHIKKELEGINIGILVNNVGTIYDWNPIEDVSEDFIWSMLYTNIGAATILSRHVIPLMKKNNKGAIINISSGSEIMPMAFAACYCATKAYIHNFTRSITYELKPFKDIKVQVVSPMIVRTNMLHKISSLKGFDSFLISDIDPYVKSAINTLGRTDRTTGFWGYAIQYGAVKLLPRWVLENFIYLFFTFYKSKDDDVNK